MSMKKRLVIGVSLVALVCLLGGIFTLAVAGNNSGQLTIGNTRYINCSGEGKYRGEEKFSCVPAGNDTDWVTTDLTFFKYETPDLDRGFQKFEETLQRARTTIHGTVAPINRKWEKKCPGENPSYVKGAQFRVRAGKDGYFDELWVRNSPNSTVFLFIVKPEQNRPTRDPYELMDALCEVNI